MRVSIIIVNYNVRYFLEQCLHSVHEATRGIESEVIVVDNASTDGSRAWLEPLFPSVRFIWNPANLGFAKANNQALALASGDNILFLNPDTILPEDAIRRCLDFLDAHPKAGALGVRMLDGTGRYLPESKRAFPGPMTSLYKLSGLSALFPRSRVFARYHLGHLDPMKDHEVDVLAGAFMFVRRSVLDKTGGFDEQFFMYGEDIDLSYRIQQAGHVNHYLSSPTILHFKGESTRKGSLNYVRMFYNAMGIFVHKHYGGVRAGFFRFFLTIAIWVRAVLSAIGQFIRRAGLPLIDAALILLAFWMAKDVWSRWVKTDTLYSERLLTIALPGFTVIYLTASYYAGLYDRYQKRGRVVRSTAIALVMVLAAYSLLPEMYRFSRAIVLLGSVFAFILLSIIRILFRNWGVLLLEDEEVGQTIVVGDETEYERVCGLMRTAGMEDRLLGRVAVSDPRQDALTTLEGLNEFIRTVPVREVVFCRNGLPFSDIIGRTASLAGRVRIRITANGSRSIVGSDSRDNSGDTRAMDHNLRLAHASNLRGKRAVDVVVALLIWLSLPLQFLFNRHPIGLLRHAASVLFGRRTWIGYSGDGQTLPRLRKGVLGTNGQPAGQHEGGVTEGLALLDLHYARDHSIFDDLERIRRGYGKLGLQGPVPMS